MADKQTLSALDWIKAGFRALTAGGPGAIKAEAIARDLKVSKGSFYWHFKDMPAFKAAMLEHWRAAATDAIIASVDSSGGGSAEQLKLLVRIATADDNTAYGGALAGLAIRDWARYDAAVAAAVKSVDERRIAYLEELFRKSGVKPRWCLSSANVLYGALIGLRDLSHEGLVDPERDLAHLLEQILRID